MYYLGTAPSPGHAGLADVLIGTSRRRGMPIPVRSGRRATWWRWRCIPTTTPIRAKLYFEPVSMKSTGGSLPGSIEVRYGDGIYQVFRCKQFKFEPAAEKPAPAGGQTGRAASNALARRQTLREAARERQLLAGCARQRFSHAGAWRLRLRRGVLPLAVWRQRESFAGVIAAAQPKMVKIYGAGGIRGLEAYQSGFLISAEGHVLTVWSYVLDTDYITATLERRPQVRGQAARRRSAAGDWPC